MCALRARRRVSFEFFSCLLVGKFLPVVKALTLRR